MVMYSGDKNCRGCGRWERNNVMMGVTLMWECSETGDGAAEHQDASLTNPCRLFFYLACLFLPHFASELFPLP